MAAAAFNFAYEWQQHLLHRYSSAARQVVQEHLPKLIYVSIQQKVQVAVRIYWLHQFTAQ